MGYGKFAYVHLLAMVVPFPTAKGMDPGTYVRRCGCDSWEATNPGELERFGHCNALNGETVALVLQLARWECIILHFYR